MSFDIIANDTMEVKKDELIKKYISGPDEPRFWMMALGIIMMLIGGGWKLRDMLKES
ncbi:MAG: hypothetical protein LBT05_01670 [Planctomycetaceae bacterium]|jgi:hypothetical protein|nr:hypothetical protein [Planctomycetaceae bacterium]